ncbi:Ger(x)C family spore germination protein [Paenibacillus eucommiae]|uniref:Spore germination protein KC n=1 Tax=Paenibacillus eucommiae TaxID=1355755 RepID=A0ABS4IU49_9BACL|nr:Ger(x)C family spore germination protein [Paenibacillus eucommiae]MBP1991116.1 spore germination protein KC [Paenibacillus eucommiae]
MRLFMAAIVIAITAFTLTGCWNRVELTDWGFVQAAAIDQTDDGKISLTTHIYKPNGDSSGQGSPGKSYIDIVTNSNTLLGASRDATTELGRKLQWSHMQVLLISEEIAKSREIHKILDFFSRDHEPRGSISILITEGRAGDYLHIQPLIENTMGQQLKKIEEHASKLSAKTLEMSITDLTIQAHEEGPSGIVVPYATISLMPKEGVSIAGLAVLNFPERKMSSLIPPAHTPYLLMLMNKFKGGIIDIPCSKESDKKVETSDSFEVIQVQTKVNPIINGDSLAVKFIITVEGAVGELNCSEVVTKEEVNKFRTKIKRVTEERLRKTITLLQQQKTDVLGIGIHMYRTHNQLWKKWKPDWEERFSHINFTVEVDVKLMNTGMNAAKPYFKR